MSSYKSNQARVIIELLCKILEENKICSVRAEVLRQAKFNKDAVAHQMGQLLFSVVCLCESHYKVADKEPTKQWIHDEQKMTYMKTKLQGWGYLSKKFAMLPHDFSTGSREFLLALGWVIHQKNFIDKIISRRSNPLHQDLFSFSKTEEVSMPNEEMLPTTGHGNQLHLTERIQYHMILTGKLRMSLRRLYRAYMQLTNLTKTIHQSTEGVSLQQHFNHLTPLEVHVLRFPGSLKRLLQELEEDNLELTDLLEWKQKETLFWDWMGSVLTADIEDQSWTSSATSPDLETYAEPSVYLPVPANIGQRIEVARDHLRDVILKHELEMSKVEGIVQRKKVSSVEVEVHKMHMDKELFEKAMQLRACGIGEETDSSKLSSNESGCEASTSEKMQFKLCNRPFEMADINKEVLSPYAAKAAKREALMQTVNQELLKLQKKVEKLETELQQRRVQNMDKVQELINMDDSVICIQPRSLKQIYNSS